MSIRTQSGDRGKCELDALGAVAGATDDLSPLDRLQEELHGSGVDLVVLDSRTRISRGRRNEMFKAALSRDSGRKKNDGTRKLAVSAKILFRGTAPR